MDNHEHMHMEYEKGDMMTGTMEGKGSPTMWHWMCCWLPVFSWILWIAAITSFVLAWVSVLRVQLIWGLGPDWWLWNALVFAVIAMPGCRRKMGYHGKSNVCMAHGAKCCCC